MFLNTHIIMYIDIHISDINISPDREYSVNRDNIQETELRGYFMEN